MNLCEQRVFNWFNSYLVGKPHRVEGGIYVVDPFWTFEWSYHHPVVQLSRWNVLTVVLTSDNLHRHVVTLVIAAKKFLQSGGTEPTTGGVLWT